MLIHVLVPSNRAPASIVQTKLITASSLHTRLPRSQHAYVWPFVFLYPAWIFVYLFRYDEWIRSEEITFVTLGLLMTIHSLLFLTCQWSVSIKASLTCKKVQLRLCNPDQIDPDNRTDSLQYGVAYVLTFDRFDHNLSFHSGN